MKKKLVSKRMLKRIVAMLAFGAIALGCSPDAEPSKTNAATPNIDAHPLSAAYLYGDTAAALTVSASKSDGGTLSYQWYAGPDSSAAGSPVEGAVSAAYTPAIAAAGAGPMHAYYYVIVTNTNNSVDGTKTASAKSNVADILMANADSHVALSFDDAGKGVFSESSFALEKSGGTASRTISLIGNWDSQTWYVNGFPKGTEPSITLNAADYAAGKYTLSATVKSGSAYWSKSIAFTVQ